MSEQTPDTENGIADGQDPSMEDILASIRKIIAEDDIQTPAAPEAVIADVVSDVPPPSGDVSELAQMETLDLDIVVDEVPAIDPDIEALIGDMDVKASDDMTPSLKSLDGSASEPSDDILDLEIPMDETEVLPEVETIETVAEIDLLETETLTLEDELIDLVAEPEHEAPAIAVEDKPKAAVMGGALAAMGLTGAAAIGKANEAEPEIEASEEDDLSLMLDNMLEDSESYEEASRDFPQDRVIDPAADLIAEDEIEDDLLAELNLAEETVENPELTSEGDPDIALVKSLMADLTETPLHDEDDLAELKAESFEAEITPETIEPENLEPEDIQVEKVEADITAPIDINNDDADTISDDIMDEILSMTIEDETELSEEIAIPEISPAPVEDIVSGDIATENRVSESPSLKEIAAAAEADAKASETNVPIAAAGLAGAAVAGTAAIASELEAPKAEIERQTETEQDDVDAALSQLDDFLEDSEPAGDLATKPDNLTPEPTTPESIIEETPEMPRAKKSDAIIDEVTETATVGAFASLTNAVEEKATVAERGDRIGDLVMEALQPMLKEWLDANLKGIVERAVTKEVKRISSGK